MCQAPNQSLTVKCDDKMEKLPSNSQRSTVIGKATLVVILLQLLLLWHSTRCALDIAVEKEAVGLSSQILSDTSVPSDLLVVTTAPEPRTHSRILMGIMAAESPELSEYARVQREVFAVHPNACSLKQLQETRSSACRIIYTFVIGANEQGSTEIVNDTTPILASVTNHSFAGDDVTLLNIR